MKKLNPLLISVALVLTGGASQAGTITVTGLGPLDCTLAAAVAYANGLDTAVNATCLRTNDTPNVQDPSDTIVFAAGVPGIVPLVSPVTITAPLVIDGGGRITVSTVLRQRLFDVSVGALENVTLTGLTFGGSGTIAPSGGVRVTTGHLIVAGSTFDANSGNFGGALHVDAGASVAVADSTFIGNEARASTAVVGTCNPGRVALGSAVAFAVFGGQSITNTGPTIVTGDIGTSPGTAIGAFGPPAAVIGAQYPGISPADLVVADITTAYNAAATRKATCGGTKDGNIGGTTLAPGLYTASSSLEVTSGDLTLDAQGDTAATWLFQVGSTFTMSSGRKIILAGGANAANVFWQIGTSATIGTGAVMVGTILADQSITMNTGATLIGRALARGASVTLDSNIVTRPLGLESGSGGTVESGGSGLIEGGAVDCFGVCGFDRVLFVDNFAFGATNQSARGGAISAHDAEVTIRNCTFSGNHVQAGLTLLALNLTEAHGGAIASTGGVLDIAFSTFVGNIADRELTDVFAAATGGAFFLEPDATSDYRLFGSIVSANTAVVGSDCDTVGIANMAADYNLFDNTGAKAACDAVSTTNLVGSAQLGILDDNGGPTQTIRFGDDSIALDAIPTPLFGCVLAGGFDQRGNIRPSGTACDIGAVELEDIALDIDGPNTFLIPVGATVDQSVAMTYTIYVPFPVLDVTFSFTVSAGVTATVRDVMGATIPSCLTAGPTTTCFLGDLDPTQRVGGIDLSFAASRTADIVWSGLIDFDLQDVEPLNDVDSGRIVLLRCGDETVTSPEVCDDGGALGGCNATCTGCDAGFTGVDCTICVGLDDGNGCTDDTCNLATGAVHTNNTAGCNDGSVCTTVDTCALGACVGGGPALVVTDGDACTDDSCDAVTGAVHVVAAAIDDGNACTTDTCNALTGPAHANNTAVCNDGDACTTTDLCALGVCAGSGALAVDDDNPCTDDSCDPAAGAVHAANTASCSDANACTTGDVCAGGVCAATGTVDVDDGNPCTDDACAPATGLASHTNNTAPCDDASVCTTGDVCAAGECKAGQPVDMDDADMCTDDKCNPVTGVVHVENDACPTGLHEAGGGGCAGGPVDPIGGVAMALFGAMGVVMVGRRRTAKIG